MCRLMISYKKFLAVSERNTSIYGQKLNDSVRTFTQNT